MQVLLISFSNNISFYSSNSFLSSSCSKIISRLSIASSIRSGFRTQVGSSSVVVWVGMQASHSHRLAWSEVPRAVWVSSNMAISERTLTVTLVIQATLTEIITDQVTHSPTTSAVSSPCKWGSKTTLPTQLGFNSLEPCSMQIAFSLSTIIRLATKRSTLLIWLSTDKTKS